MSTHKKNSTTRRNFLRITGTAAASTLAMSGFSKNSAHEKPPQKLTDRAKRLMQLFNLKYPIFQAAPGGLALATALSNAGCMGAMQMSFSSPDVCKNLVERITAGNLNIYGNFVLHFPATNLDVALQAGLKIVQFSWGIPNEEQVKKIRSANARFGVQIATKDGAMAALKHNPDFLICQGIEAGGHVQAFEPILLNLKEIVDIAGQTPVLAAGGIATGNDMNTMLAAGASGVVMGTRLIATQESNIHQVYKESLVEAKENSTVFTNCFDRQWPAMHRVLKNKTYSAWEAAGCPQSPNRPGENDVLGQTGDGTSILRYSPLAPDKKTTGELKEMIMYAGTGVKDVNDLPPASELIARFWKEFEG